MDSAIELCLNALLSNAGDSSGDVRREIIGAIVHLSKKGTSLVLVFSAKWLTDHGVDSTSAMQRCTVVNAMANIVNDMDNMHNLPRREVVILLQCGVREMTAIVDLTSLWSQEALRLVVGLCRLFPDEGSHILLSSLTEGTLPHFFILLAISNFAEKSPESILPFIKDLLTKLLPPLGAAKQDNHRMLLARACGSLAEALLKTSDDTPNTLKDYNDLMYSTLNFFIGDYSRCNEPRVRIFVTYALGCTFSLCNDEKKIELVNKVASQVLQGVRREKPHEVNFPLRGLTGLFSCVTDVMRLSLQPFVDGAFQVILQILGRIGPNDMTTREYINIAILTISKSFFGDVLTCVSVLLETKKDSHIRCAALILLRTILSQSKDLKVLLQTFLNDIIAIVKLAIGLQEEAVVRKAVVDCIVAICMSEADFSSVVGFHNILSYLILSASINETSSDALLNVRDAACNGLMLLTSSNGMLDRQLWPFLIEHIREYPIHPSLLGAFCTICNNIIPLANRVSEHSSYFYVDFSKAVNVPPPGMLAAVFLSQSMLIDFHRAEDLFTVLEASLSIAPLLDNPFSQSLGEDECSAMPIAELWSTSIPNLQRFLATEPTRENWEAEVERLVDKTLKVKQSEEWAMQFVSESLKLLQAYQGNSHMMRSGLIILGIGCSRTTRRDLVNMSVETAIDIANHDDTDHATGLAKCLGYIARKHLDTSLEALRRLANGPEKRSFFSSRDKTKKSLVQNSRSIAAVGFGYACKNMEISALPSRLDTIILPVLQSLVRENHTMGNLVAVLEGCSLVGTAIRRLDNYIFKCRDEFLNSLLLALKSAQKSGSAGSLRYRAFSALNALVSCTPLPSMGDSITSALVDSVVAAIYNTVNVNIDEDAITVGFLNELLHHHHFSSITLLLEKLGPLTTLEKDASRCLVLKLIITVLDGFRKEVMNNGSFNSTNQKYISVCIGNTLGRLVPRFMDDCPDVRVEASKGIVACILVDIISLELIKKDVEECTETILDLGKRAYVFKGDTTLSAEKEAISIIKNLCGGLVEGLHQSENIISLIRTLVFVGVFDSQRYASVGACVVMHGLIRGHGEMLDTTAVREIFDGLIEALKVDSLPEEVRNGILTSLRNLTRHHILPCFETLLRSPVPHSKAVINAVEAIAYDLSVCEMLVKHILDTVLNSPMTEASPASNNKQKNVRFASSKVLSAVCAAGWIAQTERGASVCRVHRASLYMAIVLHITVCHSICDENAVMESGKALEHVTNGTVDDVTMVRFDRYGWGNFLIKENYLLAIGEAVCYWSRDGLGDNNEMDRGKIADAKGRFALEPSVPSPLVYELARFMLSYCGHVSETYRKAAVCVCGELITFSLGDEELIRALIMALLSRTGTDEEPLTREIVLGNMVNILKHPYTEVSSFVPPTISAIIGCMEPQHPSLSTKAISVITILAEGLEDKSFIDASIVTIVTKLKSLFENQDANLRIMIFDCFRRLYILANCGKLKKDCVSQHVYPYVIPLLVHLAEKENNVCISAKGALRELLEFITSLHLEAGKKIKQILSKPHMLVSHETNVRELYDDVALTWVCYFSGMVKEYLLQAVSFTRSPVDLLRRNAAWILGAFISRIPPEELSRCGVEQVSTSLVELVGVSEKSETVRIAAAVAMGSFSGI